MEKKKAMLIEGEKLFSQHLSQVPQRLISTDVSQETILKELRGLFALKVILVNHEKRLTVDTTCANLAIKYNLIYISVYQLIKHHIENNTDYGKRLLATKKPRDIKLQTQAKDEFNEIEYSAVHYELPLVMELIAKTISEVRRGSQRFVLIEGFCNSNKLIFDHDKLELRYMDELFNIEKTIGEIIAVIGLQFHYEKEYMEENEIEYEVFPDPEPVVVQQQFDEDGNPIEPEVQQEEQEGENKKPKFKPEDFKWTITDGKPKNLPQLFNQCKGVNTINDTKTAEQFSSS
mmetsp:Transcript_22762/g.21964  ORF Transcript_22762/g.21964 Transcript_22762/m.21964 type:complete len:289 (+) Transcript_22762:1990-2856(+)